MGHQLLLEGLPSYAWPGGALEGTFVLETDKPLRATDASLALHGREVAQVTVQTGKNSQVLVETYPFLELVSSFRGALPFTDGDHIAAGTYRLPFRFDLPANGEPSLATSERTGRLSGRSDGMYVEYELEARVDVPWWVDAVERAIVPVFSSRRVLGAIPPMDSPSDGDRASFRLRFDAPMIVPGTDVTGTYEVTNPRGKDLSGLDVRLYRHVEYQARGRAAQRDGPETSVFVPLGGRAPSYSGAFRIPLPNTRESTGPFHGQLYRTWWVAYATLKVPFGLDVRVEASFTPA